MTKRGVSSIIPRIYDISGHITPYIRNGKSILSRIWAYEKAVSPKLEEVTSHDKADILLSHFKESNDSCYGLTQNSGTKTSNRKKDDMQKNDITSNSDGVVDTNVAFGSHEKIENDPSGRPPLPHDNELDDVYIKHETTDGSDGIASASSQSAPHFK